MSFNGGGARPGAPPAVRRGAGRGWNLDETRTAEEPRPLEAEAGDSDGQARAAPAASTAAPTTPVGGTEREERHGERPPAAWHGLVPALRTTRRFGRLGRRVRPPAALAWVLGLLVLGACGPKDGGGGPEPQEVDLCLALDGDGPLMAPPAGYPTGQVHSPLTPEVADFLREVAGCHEERRPEVFAKVGDSMSQNPMFLGCFVDEEAVDLGDRTDLAETRAFFLEGEAGETTPFDREGYALQVGRNSYEQLEGDPSPLEQELAAISPRYAVVMMGTNDVSWRTIDEYGESMWSIVDGLLGEGVVPILNTLPPVVAYPSMDARIPDWNGFLRGLAAWRRIPLVDAHLVFSALPNSGLGEDGVHPSVDWVHGGASAACDLTQADTYGHNARNLVTLEALDRVRQVVEGRRDALDDGPAGPARAAGSPDDPVPVTGSPFADLRRIDVADASRLGAFSGCEGDGRGAEVVYALQLDAPAEVRAVLVDRRDLDADLTLVDGLGEGARCYGRSGENLERELEAGTWYLLVDVVAGSGDYLLSVRTVTP